MKKLLLAFCVTTAGLVNAQTTFTWTGAVDNTFSNAGNWNPAGPPSTTDNVQFDGSSSVNCTFDAFVEVGKMSILSGYTGTIDAGASGASIDTSFVQQAGTLLAGTNAFAVANTATISGGTFQGVSAGVSFGGATTLSGGSFNAGNMTCDFGDVLTCSGITFDGSSAALTVAGLFTQSAGTFSAGTGSWLFSSNMLLSGGTFQGQSASLGCGGSFTLSGATFNSTSGDFTYQGNLFKRISGTFNHNGGQVISDRPLAFPTSTIMGTITFNRLQCTSTANFPSTRMMNFSGSITTATLNLNGAAWPFRYIGSITITSNLSINGTNTTATSPNTGTFIMGGTGAVTISGAATALCNPLGNVNVNTTGTLSMSGQITVRNNWTNTNCGTFSAGSSTVVMAGSSSITGGATAATRANFDYLTVPASSTCGINASSQINVFADMSNSGVLNTNTSLIRLTGSGAQAIGGSSSYTINAMDVSNSGTKTLNSAVTILDSLGVTGAGTLASGGFMTLHSVASKKARIARLAAGGDVTGNVVVQNYFPGGTTGWANLCSPGLAGQTMQNWANNFAIVCAGCPNTQVGGSPFESVYWYDETAAVGSASASAHYITISGLGDPIATEKGYWVYLGNGFPNTTDITAVMTGAINKNGGVSYSLTRQGGAPNSENGWNLVSNPFPSPVSLSNMFTGNTGNVDGSILVWNADLNGGNGDWAVYTLGGATDAIPMGQGFMVRLTNLASLNLTSSENWKTTSSASVQKIDNNGFNISNLFKLNLTGGGQGFDTYTYFDFQPTYSSGFDNMRDIYFLDNATGNTVAQIYSQVGQEKFMSAALPLMAPNATSIIPIHVPTGYNAPYTITGMNFNALPNLCFELIDLNNNNLVHDLQTGPYTTTIAVNDGSSAPFNLRVSNCNSNPTAIHENQGSGSVLINRNSTGVYVKMDFDQSTNSTIAVTNILGQKIIDDKKVNAAKDLIYLDIPEKNQVIFVTVTSDNGSRITKKLIY